MRLWFVAFALAAEIPLRITHKLFPQHASFLPLGGDDFTQLAILILMAVWFDESIKLIAESLKNLTGMIRSWKKGRGRE